MEKKKKWATLRMNILRVENEINGKDKKLTSLLNFASNSQIRVTW
jgi:hypothetical protein